MNLDVLLSNLCDYLSLSTNVGGWLINSLTRTIPKLIEFVRCDVQPPRSVLLAVRCLSVVVTVPAG